MIPETNLPETRNGQAQKTGLLKGSTMGPARRSDTLPGATGRMVDIGPDSGPQIKTAEVTEVRLPPPPLNVRGFGRKARKSGGNDGGESHRRGNGHPSWS